MTRATLKLKIFCESEELFNYFNEKVNNILELKKTNDEVTKIVQENTTNPSNQKGNGAIVTGLKYDVFIAYHGTNDPNGSYIVAKAIADELKKSGFSVFLNDYLCFPDDEDLGFNETCYILQKADVFLLVFNDFVSRDELGMIMRKYDDGTPNQLYHELRTFTDMVNTGERTNRKNLRFFYSGNRISKDSIYRFLNSFYREGTYGNSNCCFYNINEILSWLKNRKK
jgi:hypothetical protein